MDIKIHASFEVNDYLKSVIEQKVGKLSTFFEPVISADVFLKIGESRHRVAEDQTAEVKIEVPQQTFYAEEHSDSFERAVTLAAEKVRRQMIKHKQQLQQH